MSVYLLALLIGPNGGNAGRECTQVNASELGQQTFDASFMRYQVSRATQGYMDDTGDYTASMFTASVPASQTSTGYATAITDQVREVKFATCEHRGMTFVYPMGPILDDGVDYVEQVGIASDVTAVDIKYSTRQGEPLRDQQPKYGSKEPGDHRGHIRARALGGPRSR